MLYLSYLLETCVLSNCLLNNKIYYTTSDNVFSDWLTSLVTFFDKTL